MIIKLIPNETSIDIIANDIKAGETVTRPVSIYYDGQICQDNLIEIHIDRNENSKWQISFDIKCGEYKGIGYDTRYTAIIENCDIALNKNAIITIKDSGCLLTLKRNGKVFEYLVSSIEFKSVDRISRDNKIIVIAVVSTGYKIAYKAQKRKHHSMENSLRDYPELDQMYALMPELGASKTSQSDNVMYDVTDMELTNEVVYIEPTDPYNGPRILSQFMVVLPEGLEIEVPVIDT